MKIKCQFGEEIKCNQVKHLHLNGGSDIFHPHELSSKCIYNTARFYFYFSQVVYLYCCLRIWHNHRNPSAHLILGSLGSPCMSDKIAGHGKKAIWSRWEISSQGCCLCLCSTTATILMCARVC